MLGLVLVGIGVPPQAARHPGLDGTRGAVAHTRGAEHVLRGTRLETGLRVVVFRVIGLRQGFSPPVVGMARM
ncbi:hypothetical protein GCM10025787_57660 [Saccharopolyspora rosea]